MKSRAWLLCLGGGIAALLGFLFLPGMRDIERSGVLVGTPIDATEDTGFGALEGPLAPISAGQEPFPTSGTSEPALRSPVRPTDI